MVNHGENRLGTRQPAISAGLLRIYGCFPVRSRARKQSRHNVVVAGAHLLQVFLGAG